MDTLLFIIFVAGLQSQDEEIEEAVRLDGATWSKIFWNISLPQMRPVIAVALVVRVIDITTMFANVFIITKVGPALGQRPSVTLFIEQALNSLILAMLLRPRLSC